MASQLPFRDILEGAEGLSVEEQEALVEALRNRLRERRRAELAHDVEARKKNSPKAACDPRRPTS